MKSVIAEEIRQDEKPIKTVKQWLNRKDIPSGFTVANAKFKFEYGRLSREFGKRAAILYTIGVTMEARYVTKMFWSVHRQARLCRAIAATANSKMIDKDARKVLDRDLKAQKKRLDTVDRITKEDLHLTEYEPFFESLKSLDGIDFRDLPDMANAWNEEHADIVAAHMEKVQPEIDRHKAFLERKHAKQKAEKEAAKKAKREENAYVKELRENARKNRKEHERIERSFERYYTGRA